MTRLPLPVLSAAAALLLLVATATAAGRPTPANWDSAQQRQVVHAQLMGNVGRSFAGASSLSASQADAAMNALTPRLARASLAQAGTVNPAQTHQSPVTVSGFDALLVNELGLSDVAAHVQSVAAQAGLAPPRYFGTEVVARFLGLRYNHPTGTDALELFPTDQITRAEAAWSLAQVLAFGDWQVSYTRQTLSAFALPQLTTNQLTALRIAVSRIGYPYVWGGTTDNTADGLAHGGFDCSGFVWRVYKISGLSWGQKLRGRTAAQQAGEIPRSQRLRTSQLQPGDTLYFGSAHFNSPATESNIIHAGIYLGDNWVIHSSDQGVYVLPLKGSWLGQQFAWGRRII